MKHDFQLTYSIKPIGNLERHKKAAQKSRELLKKLNGWHSVEDIETTLVGELSLNRVTFEGRRREAKEKVYYLVKNLLQEHEVEEHVIYKDVQVFLSLMVDRLGKHITFSI